MLDLEILQALTPRTRQDVLQALPRRLLNKVAKAAGRKMRGNGPKGLAGLLGWKSSPWKEDAKACAKKTMLKRLLCMGPRPEGDGKSSAFVEQLVQQIELLDSDPDGGLAIGEAEEGKEGKEVMEEEEKPVEVDEEPLLFGDIDEGLGDFNLLEASPDGGKTFFSGTMNTLSGERETVKWEGVGLIRTPSKLKQPAAHLRSESVHVIKAALEQVSDLHRRMTTPPSCYRELRKAKQKSRPAVVDEHHRSWHIARELQFGSLQQQWEVYRKSVIRRKHGHAKKEQAAECEDDAGCISRVVSCELAIRDQLGDDPCVPDRVSGECSPLGCQIGDETPHKSVDRRQHDTRHVPMAIFDSESCIRTNSILSERSDPELDDDVLKEAFAVATMVVCSTDLPAKSTDWMLPELVRRTESGPDMRLFCDGVESYSPGNNLPRQHAPGRLGGHKASALPKPGTVKTPRGASHPGSVKQAPATTPRKSQSCKGSLRLPARVQVKSKGDSFPDPPSGKSSSGRLPAKRSSAPRRRSISASEVTPRGKMDSSTDSGTPCASPYSTPTRKVGRSVSEARLGSQRKVSSIHSKAGPNPRTGFGPTVHISQKNSNLNPRKCLTPREVENGPSKLRSPFGPPQRLSIPGSPQIGNRTPNKRSSLGPAKLAVGGTSKFK